MSLDVSKLENVRKSGRKTTARCPACAEAGHDQTRNHLIVGADGRFGCVVHPGDSPGAREHRKRIFALCGTREIRPLVVRRSDLGRLGRVDQTHSAGEPLKTGLLGRLGRLFQTHSRTEPALGEKQGRGTENLNDCGRSVLGVLNDPTATPHRPLSKRERALLMRCCGNENDPLIITALNLFHGRLVG